MTASFALLEAQIKSLIATLLKSSVEVGRIVTAELSVKAMRNLLESLYIYSYGKDENYDELRGLIVRCNEVEARRNALTHSQWAAGPDAQGAARIKETAREKKGLHTQYEEILLYDMQSFVMDIKALSWDYFDFEYLLKTGFRFENHDL